MSVSLTIERRDLLYEDTLTHLSGLDGLWSMIVRDEFETADRLAHEFIDDLRLIQSDLGWGHPEDIAGIELTLPPDDLRRILGRLRDRAERHIKNQEREMETAREPLEQSRLVLETCDAVFAELDHAKASPSNPTP